MGSVRHETIAADAKRPARAWHRVMRVASERSWGRAWRDFAPVAAVLALCPVVALLAPGPAVPLSHIRALVDEERALGLFFEPSLHRWAAAHPPLLLGGQIGYVVAHVPVLLSVLVDRKSTRLNSSHELKSRMPYH